MIDGERLDWRKLKENVDCIYSGHPVIRTCTYSNNSFIRSKMAYSLNQLTKLRQQHSQLSEFQLFELSVIRSDFHFPWGKLYAKSSSVIRIFLIGRSSSENIDFHTFFLQKIQVSIFMAIYTFQANSSISKMTIMMKLRHMTSPRRRQSSQSWKRP